MSGSYLPVSSSDSGGGGAPHGNGPPPNNPIMSYYNEWTERCPFVTRYTTITMVICYLLSWLFEASVMLGNVPYFTIFSFEIYRLITSPFVGNSIIDLVMILLFFPTMGGRMEASLGSAAYLVLLVTLALVTNILFILICLSSYLLGMVTALFFTCAGFWNVLFALVTIECMQVPDQPRRMFMLPVDIPSKYFPLVLYFAFILFSGPILSYLLAILVGFLYSQGYLEKLKPTSYYLEGLEGEGGMFHSISRSAGWILAGAAIGHDAWVATNSVAAGGSIGTGASTQGAAAGGAAGGDNRSNPFSGTGHRLTSGQNATATPFGASTGGGGWLGGAFSSPAPASSSSSSSSAAAAAATATTNATDRETMAARRLAALTGRSDREQQEHLLGNEGATNPADLQKLQDMGFSRQDAERALGLSGGSLSGALRLLTT